MTTTVLPGSPVRVVLQPGDAMEVTSHAVGDTDVRVGRLANGTGEAVPDVPHAWLFVTAGTVCKIGGWPFSTRHYVEATAGSLSYRIFTPEPAGIDYTADMRGPLGTIA